MPWLVLGVLFASMTATALVMLFGGSYSRAALISLALGALAIPLAASPLPFWAALYAPLALGVLFGGALGSVAREERLTALLLITSAALAAVPPLWPYKSVTHWQPPWTATDVLLITFIELFAVAIFTWLVAAVLLLLLAALIAGPLNVAAHFDARLRSPQSGVCDSVNVWFKDRFQIVFGILGIISEVGSSRAELEMARLRAGVAADHDKFRR